MSFWTAQNKQYAMQALMSGAGLSAMGAAGLVSRWANVEAAAGPVAINRSSGAYGIAQWLDRKPALFRYTGTQNPSFDQQLNFAVYELNGAEARAANVLRAATTPDEAARGASMYERAEGYNPNTGRDNWTARTASGIPAVYALLGPSTAPSNVADSMPVTDYQDSAISTPGQTTKIVIIAAIAGLAFYLYQR